jgi:hypothetical protein
MNPFDINTPQTTERHPISNFRGIHFAIKQIIVYQQAFVIRGGLNERKMQAFKTGARY